MNIKKKALPAIPAVMALSATDVSSKVLLMSDNGWEVSFDGLLTHFTTIPQLELWIHNCIRRIYYRW